MNPLEALISMTQTALRSRGQWCVEGIDATMRQDIHHMATECARLLWLDDYCVERAVAELERRACLVF